MPWGIFSDANHLLPVEKKSRLAYKENWVRWLSLQAQLYLKKIHLQNFFLTGEQTQDQC